MTNDIRNAETDEGDRLRLMNTGTEVGRQGNQIDMIQKTGNEVVDVMMVANREQYA